MRRTLIIIISKGPRRPSTLVRPTNGTPILPTLVAVPGLTGSVIGLSGLVVVVATLGQILSTLCLSCQQLDPS